MTLDEILRRIAYWNGYDDLKKRILTFMSEGPTTSVEIPPKTKWQRLLVKLHLKEKEYNIIETPPLRKDPGVKEIINDPR